MTPCSLKVMRQGLTAAYARGLESLELRLGPAAADGTIPILPYDFRGYQDLYGRLPDSPRYLLTPALAAGEELDMRVWFRRDSQLPEESVDMVVPAGWPAGRSIAVPIPGAATQITNGLRLTRFQPRPPASRAPAAWALTALLGNLAKLLWAVGWEYEELDSQLADVTGQRNAVTAHGNSLDLLGSDLGVRRFPPRPYSWDPDTLALYHLDDVPAGGQPEVVTVLDDRSRYDTTSHSGQNNGGHSRQPGRFGSPFRSGDQPDLVSFGGAFGFSEQGTFIVVADHPDFALPAAASFTVEALVMPDPGALATGAVIAKRPVLNTAAAAGWALSTGSFRGFDHNLRFSLCDGAAEVELFADRNLADGVYHHVACAVERRAGPPAIAFAHLYMDGIEVARRRVDGLGALTSAAPIQIGFGTESAGGQVGAQYVGLVDEVRISKIARSSFNPAVGEGDDEYRRRLRLFQRWTLPDPGDLQDAMNKVADPVAGDPAPFVIDETTDPIVTGTRLVRVLPSELRPGQCIAADGGTRSSEAAAAGTADSEPDFDEAWLVRHPDAPGLDFGGVEANRRMQVSASLALDRLQSSSSPGLRVLRAYDPSATDLHRVGRALLLQHASLAPSELGVLAFAAGFDFVCHVRDGSVHAAQRRQDVLLVTPAESGASPRLPDVLEGGTLALGLVPDLTTLHDVQLSWRLARCGFGDATLTVSPPALHAVRAGDIALHVEATRRRRTRGGSRTFRIGLGPASLHTGQSISGSGERGVTELAAAGAPSPAFDPAYLVSRADDLAGVHANVTYGPDPATRLMQRSTGRALDRLLDLLETTAGSLVVDKAFDPAATGVATQGRALRLHHSSLDVSALAAQCFAAGFDFIRVDAGAPPSVFVAVAEAELIDVEGPLEVRVAQAPPAVFSVAPRAEPVAVCFAPDGSRAYVADSGSDLVTRLAVAASPAGAFPAIGIDRTAEVASGPVAVTATAARLYAATTRSGASAGGAVAVLDGVTLQALATIATGPGPTAITNDGGRVFVACSGDRTVRAYDVATNQQVAISAVLADVPVALALAPNATLYVVLQGGQVVQVGTGNLQPVGATAQFATGSGPRQAAVTADGQKLYVACAGDGSVRVYATSSNQQTASITGFPAGSPPAALAIGADQRHVYVATAPAAPATGRVDVVDATTDTLLQAVFTPAGTSRSVAASPAAAPYLPCLLAASDRLGTVTLGDPAPLAEAIPRPPLVVATLSLGSGIGDQLAWSAVPFSQGQLEPRSASAPAVVVDGMAPGWALVRAAYVRGAGLRPYQFAVRLNPALTAQADVTIPKDQYDLVMNVLNALHPIGVEISTRALRERVIELRGDVLRGAFPGFTFPDFRARDASPGLIAAAARAQVSRRP